MQSYEMRTPVVSVNGDFVAIGDQQGNSIYICDKNGTQGQATTLLPILRVTVSAKAWWLPFRRIPRPAISIYIKEMEALWTSW